MSELLREAIRLYMEEARSGADGSGWNGCAPAGQDRVKHKEERLMNDRLDLTPVALYARVSSDRQDVDLSIAAQLRALRDYAEKHDYLVAREYVDEAESGRIANRPEFQKMLNEAAKPRGSLQGDSHPPDTIATENSGIHGRSIWVHSS